MDGDERASFAAKLATLRSRAGLSLAELGAAAHIARGYVHHVENGRRWPSAGVVRALDAALDADGVLFAAWELGAKPRRLVQRCREIADASIPLTISTPPTDSPLIEVVAVRAMAQALQAADRQIGGGRLYPSVLRYLHAEIAPALVDSQSDNRPGELFAAAASLTEIAGWMAHDGGQDDAAHGHFSSAYRLATAAGSNSLAANVCASMSHLAGQFGQARDAVRIAEVGLDRARAADGVAPLVARLHAMRARGLTLRGHARETTVALEAAERVLGTTGAETAEWIAGFDEAALAGEAALCLLALGELAAAERAAKRVIELRDGDRVRSRAFGQLTLARVLIHAGRPDEAAVHGRAVCAVTPRLTSARVHRQLTGLGAALYPYRGATEVAGFLGQLAMLPATTRREPVWPV